MRIFFFLWLLCGSVFAADFNRSFWYPMYFGERLAFCSKDESQCGKVIAQGYCREMGYQKVRNFRIAPNVGRTHFLNRTGECTGWKCDGFLFIGCQGQFNHHSQEAYHYRKKAFVYPRVRNHRISWCYKQNSQCGHRAAYSFCRRLGYTHVETFEQDTQNAATQALGDHTLCYGQHCRGFKKIICKR